MERDDMIAERMEQEAQRWATSRLDDAALARFRQHVVDVTTQREALPEETMLLKVLDRAIEIRGTK